MKLTDSTSSSGANGNGGSAKARNSLLVTAVVAFYFVTSICLVFLNKYMFSSKGISLDAPVFLTWTQIVVAVICCYLFSTFNYVSYLNFFPSWQFNFAIALKVMPLTLVFLGMIVFNNLCLKHVEVSFYQVARALTIVFNIIFTYTVLGQSTSQKAVASCAVVVVGYLMGCDGEVNFSMKGVIYGVLSSGFVCLYSIYVKKILPVLNNNEWLLMIYNNVNAMIVMPILIILLDEAKEIANYPMLWDSYFWNVTLITGLFGFLINISTFLQIKYTSPLTHNVSGTAKAGVQTILGVIVYRNPVSGQAAFGTFLSIFGCGLYSYVRYQEMQTKPTNGGEKSNGVATKENVALATLPSGNHGNGSSSLSNRS